MLGASPRDWNAEERKRGPIGVEATHPRTNANMLRGIVSKTPCPPAGEIATWLVTNPRRREVRVAKGQ